MAETTATTGKSEHQAESLTKEKARVRDVDPIAERDRISFPLGQPIRSDKDDPYRNQVRPLDPDGILVVSGSVLHRVAAEPIEVLPGDPIPPSGALGGNLALPTPQGEMTPEQQERHDQVAADAKAQREADEKRGEEAKAKAEKAKAARKAS